MANKINSWTEFQDFMDACCKKANAHPENAGHGVWWRDMDHQKFVTDGTVKGLRIVSVGDPDNSVMIHALRGDTPEFKADDPNADYGRMPLYADSFFEKVDIDEIADWIGRGCPDTKPAPPVA
jgi:hypothetical protein